MERVSVFQCFKVYYKDILLLTRIPVATNLHLENINLLPIDGKGTSNTYCDPTSFADGTQNLGFVCANGPYKAI